MLLTPHAVVGAVIGSGILGPDFQRAWIIAPLSIGSHFLLDSIPHWDLDTEELEKKDVLVVLLDIVLACFITWLVTLNNPNWEMMWLGAMSASVPDTHNLFHVIFNPDKFKRYTNAHDKYHSKREIRFLPGIALQVVVILIAVFILGR